MELHDQYTGSAHLGRYLSVLEAPDELEPSISYNSMASSRSLTVKWMWSKPNGLVSGRISKVVNNITLLLNWGRKTNTRGREFS
jgi:hypothetical protein